jgi:TolB protein
MKKFATILIFMTAFFCTSVFAALNLTLTQGIAGTIPITLSPFQGDDGSVSTVVQNDLVNSGRFKSVEEGGDATLTGNVETSWSTVKIHFQLLGKDKTNPPLLDKTLEVPKTKLRQAAHQISDQVYQALTGIRGVFSTRIAYILVQRNTGGAPKYALEVSDYDGFNPRPLLTSPQPILSPAWSHDGRKIAYVSFENGNSQIYISDVATGSRALVSAFPGINGAPAWSSNDSQLALVLSKSGNTKIYLMDIGSKQLTPLTSGASIDTEPSFSPDGQSILFTSDRGGSPQIYRMGLSNRQISRMTFNGNYNARASFSPDASQIVMIHAGSDTRGYGIGLQDLQSGAYLVLDNSGDDQSPSFAPNGQMVVFASKTGMNRQLALVSTDGKIRLRLPSDAGDVQEPVWSPFLN